MYWEKIKSFDTFVHLPFRSVEDPETGWRDPKNKTLRILKGHYGRTPPLGPTFVNFMQFSEKKMAKIICLRPPLKPHREILDLPLQNKKYKIYVAAIGGYIFLDLHLTVIPYQS